MEQYLAYWRRGWWAWLFMLVANLSLMVLMLPLAIIFSANPTAYWIGAVIAWLVVYAAAWGWLFERFAARSQRIVREPDHATGR